MYRIGTGIYTVKSGLWIRIRFLRIRVRTTNPAVFLNADPEPAAF